MAKTTRTKDSDSVVEVREIEGKGRGMVATQWVRGGEVLLRDSPILLYSAIPWRHGEFCSYCYRKLELDGGSYCCCPNCSYHAVFCNPNCQSLALSSSHSPWVCQSLRYSSSLHRDSQVQLHFLIAAYNLAFTSPSHFQLLLSLQGGGGGGGGGEDSQTLALHSLLSSLSPPPLPLGVDGGGGVGFSPQLTAALLAKDKQNAFGLMEPFQGNQERSVRAYAIYPKASFFNHDCLPNACRFDYLDQPPPHPDTNNTDIIVRAIHDIPEGREVSLSYFPVNWVYSDRQTRLLEDYGFVCRCDRCNVEINWKDDDDDEDDIMKGDEEEEEEEEDDDDVQQMEEGAPQEQQQEQEDDFPHAYFFISYVCAQDNCGGTLAPLPPSQHNAPSVHLMECNVCGRFSSQGHDAIMVDD